MDVSRLDVRLRYRRHRVCDALSDVTESLDVRRARIHSLFLDDTPQIRRALQQFVNALPPNHELMLVTTGGQMNIRIQPTRDYLEILEAAQEITRMRQAGNAMVGSVQEIYDRYMRTAERRYPMIVILTGDGNDASQRITDKEVNALLNGLRMAGRVAQQYKQVSPDKLPSPR